MENKRYNYYKELHPEWSEEQIWTAVSIDMQAKTTVKDGGDDIDINSPSIMRAILEGARVWLESVLPGIFEKVQSFFNNLLSNIGEWAKKGIEWLLEKIGTVFNW